ncbi:MAG TPA: SPOR domain-containing protein [Thermodesulfovibrionales bacterium]|nr:SPOR domain-containing protein [Thermodesulfovibrionales bacterium]
MPYKAILLIDSDRDTQQRIEAILESEDHLVFTASTEELGITTGKKVNPALIFVNPAMAGGTGLDFCRKLHETEALSNVPIIILSPFEGEIDPRHRSMYGIVDALAKSFEPEELIAKTELALSLQPPEAAPPAAGESVLDEEAVVEEAIVKVEDVDIEIPETVQKATWEEPSMPEEPAEMEEITGKTDDTLLSPKTNLTRRRNRGNKITLPIIAVLIFAVLATAGLIVYNSLLKGREPKPPVVAAPVPPAPPKPVQEIPLKEVAAKEQAVPAPSVSPPQAPAPTAPETKEPAGKPVGKTVYSVQIGAFQNEKNAGAVVKQFKDKGYDAFVRSIAKDKEMIHRVMIGKFENRKEAWKLAREIAEKENVRPVVTGE